jgi:hypothetical protein
MRTRDTAVAALGLLGVGGPLLVVGLPPSVGLLARAGIVALWLGLALAIATVLQIHRINHRMLRSQAARVKALQDAASGPGALSPELVARLDADRAELGRELVTHRREIQRVVDARLLGLYEGLRESGTGP